MGANCGANIVGYGLVIRCVADETRDGKGRFDKRIRVIVGIIRVVDSRFLLTIIEYYLSTKKNQRKYYYTISCIIERTHKKRKIMGIK